MASDIKWIKITTDIFDDEKILLIESLPEGDSILVIWFKLLALAGKQNYSGILMLNDRVHYTDEMLAVIFRRPLNTVKMALSTFQKFGMIEVVEHAITIPNWDKHQSTEQLSKVKERNRIRQERFREKQKTLVSGQKMDDNSGISMETEPLIEGENVTDFSRNVTVTDDVTQNNALDIEKDKEINNSNIIRESAKEVLAYLNERVGSRFKLTGSANVKIIGARLREGFTVEDLKCVIDNMAAVWIGTKYEGALNPTSLFRPTKIENYLNWSVPNQARSKPSNVPKWAERPVEKSEMTPEERKQMAELRAKMVQSENEKELADV